MSQVEIAPISGDSDPAETAEWLESLQYALETKGPERVAYLLSKLNVAAHTRGVEVPFSATTPYINTIPADKQPVFPGNREIERRIKSIIRWNAMAMVVRANKRHPGLGGHLSTYASTLTLWEVGFHHFFRDLVGSGLATPACRCSASVAMECEADNRAVHTRSAEGRGDGHA